MRRRTSPSPEGRRHTREVPKVRASGEAAGGDGGAGKHGWGATLLVVASVACAESYCWSRRAVGRSAAKGAGVPFCRSQGVAFLWRVYGGKSF